jgi:hypothetical protein
MTVGHNPPVPVEGLYGDFKTILKMSNPGSTVQNPKAVNV